MPPLTPEQEQRRLELIQEQNKAAKELASTYEKIAKTAEGLTEEQEAALNVAKQLSAQASNLEKSAKDRTSDSKSFFAIQSNISKLQKDALKNEGFIRKLEFERLQAQGKLRELSADAAKKAKESQELQNKHIGQIDRQLALEAQLEQARAGTSRADKDRARQLAAQVAQGKIDVNETLKNVKLKEKEAELSKKAYEDQKNIVNQVNDTIKANEIINEQRKKEIELSKKALGNTIVSNALHKAGLGDLLSWKGIYAFIVQAGFKANAQTTELGKSLGISYGSASKIRDSYASYVKNSKDTFINVERLSKAQAALTEQLGIAVQFSEQELETFSRLTEIVGLTADEAGNIAKFSAVAGMESRDYVAEIRKGAFYAQQANKIHISDKELLSTIGKLSAGILVKFQGNPKALAESVIQAKKLGLNLEQVDKIGQSMLEWESSIENELEAELLTGKKLNFERARAAALTGDQATLMQEVASQAGSLAEFQNMNVIAQSSLAKAFGMSREEMSEMLMKQEAINKYGSEAEKLNAQQLKDFEKSGLSLDEYLAKQTEQQNAQEKFNNAVTRLQEIIGNLVAGPFGELLGKLADALGFVSKLVAGVIQIGESFGGVSGILLGLIPILLKASSIARVFAIKGFQAGVASIFQSFAKVPFGLGIPLAIAAVAGLSSLFSSKGDDVVSDGGYGNRTLTTPKGTIKLNNQDTVIAGTNLFDKGRSSNTGNAGMMAAISNLATAMNNKPTPTPQFALNVDGQQLGSVVGRQQETGTQQTKNAYRLA